MNMSSPHSRFGQVWLPLLATAIVVGLGSAGGWWYFSRPAALAPDQGQVLVEEFLAQLRQGKTDQAWQGTAADFKSYWGKESFRAFVGNNPVLKQSLQLQRHDISGKPRPEYVYQNAAGSAKSKPSRTVTVRLVREGESWKVESLGIE